MKDPGPQILAIQKAIRAFDLQGCKGAGNVVVEEIRKRIADPNIVTHSR